MYDPYEEAEEQQREAAKLITPNPAAKSKRVLIVGAVIFGIASALVVAAGIAGVIMHRQWAPDKSEALLTMGKDVADQFGDQQAHAAGMMGRPAAPSKSEDPYDEENGVPPKTAAQDAAEHGAAHQKSAAELARERRLAEMEHRRENDLDSSPSSIDFSDYFAREKQQQTATDAKSPAAAATAPVETAEARVPRERRSAFADVLQDPQGETPIEDQSKKEPHDPQEDYVFDKSWGKLYRLMEGTVIETVLVNRLTGAASGQLIVMVTTDVYSRSGAHLLIPKGTRIVGGVSAVSSLNQERLFVAFHRMILPDGYSVSLDKFKGLDVIGQTGLRDQVNRHYLQIFGASLALSAIASVSEIGNTFGYTTYDWGTEMRNGAATGFSEAAQRVMERFLNVLPSFTIRERTRVTIMLSNDLLIPDIKNHLMDPDL